MVIDHQLNQDEQICQPAEEEKQHQSDEGDVRVNYNVSGAVIGGQSGACV